MKKAGGIIALIAGIFALFAAGFTLFFGGLGSAFDAEGADTVIGLGWGGVLFSFITIILGAVAISAKGRVAGILLIASSPSVLGAILGGTFVAIFMGLALVGGIIEYPRRRQNGKRWQLTTHSFLLFLPPFTQLGKGKKGSWISCCVLGPERSVVWLLDTAGLLRDSGPRRWGDDWKHSFHQRSAWLCFLSS